MPIDYPFFRCVRPGTDGHYSEGGRWMYVTHPKYASDALHFIRTFTVLQNDLLRLFEFIEPGDENEGTYSFRCLDQLMRACGEVEVNCKAILRANGYSKTGDWKMPDYRKLEATHHLSSFQVRLPAWRGSHSVRQPFAAWANGGSLKWYQDHHGGKHDRHQEFPKASLGNVVDAMSAVVVLLASQFYTFDFRPQGLGTSIGRPSDSFEQAIGDYFEVKFPTNWPMAERYDFDWQILAKEPHPFRQLSF